MEEKRWLEELILTAAGEKKAQLVLKGARVVNVFSEELEEADVAVHGGRIVGLGSYEGETEVDVSGKIICPGFLDGHIHLESSMVAPADFARTVVPHGTTTVITDPHEIANVAGTEGIDYILDETEELDLDVFVMLPSCVPSTGLDEAGAVLLAKQLRPYYSNPRVLGLAELMNAYGTVHADSDILDKVLDARKAGKIIDGHAPGIGGNPLNAYAAAGVAADHECSNAREAMEKLRRGQWIMIREGTAAQNLEALMPLCRAPYYHRCMFVTDDKHPGDLLKLGHIDYIIRKAVGLGADPIAAIKMGSLHAAQYFGLKDRGAVAPGYRADLVVLSNLEQMEVCQVYKDGRLVAGQGKMTEPGADVQQEAGTAGKAAPQRPTGAAEKEARYPHVYQSFHLDEVTERDLCLTPRGCHERVLCLTPRELLTWEKVIPWAEYPGVAPGVNLAEDVVKLAVLERHHHTGHIGIGFLGGYGLRAGAVATSVAHDSHNLIVAGVTDADMVLAANTVRKNRGGLAVVKDGTVLGELALPIGGVMTPEPAAQVEEKLEKLKALTRELGIPDTIDAFMTLAFTSLPVIPRLRLNTYGLIDTEKQEVIGVTF